MIDSIMLFFGYVSTTTAERTIAHMQKQVEEHYEEMLDEQAYQTTTIGFTAEREN